MPPTPTLPLYRPPVHPDEYCMHDVNVEEPPLLPVPSTAKLDPLFDARLKEAYDAAFRTARKAGALEDEAWDIAVKVILKVLKRCDEGACFEHKAEFFSYVKQATGNQLKDARRDNARQGGWRTVSLTTYPDAVLVDGPDAALVDAEYWTAIQAGVGNLTKQQRRVYELVFHREMPHRDAAAALGITPGRVTHIVCELRAELLAVRNEYQAGRLPLGQQSLISAGAPRTTSMRRSDHA